MTQEELDALMAGDLDAVEEESSDSTDDIDKEIKERTYSIAEDDGVYPPPATEEHKVVHQLDDVTKESEEKARGKLER